VRGDASAPALSFDLDATELRYADFSAREVRGGGAIDLGPQNGGANATLRIDGITSGGHEFDHAQLRLAGTRDALTISLDARALGTDATLLATGAWRDRGFDG